MKTQFKYAFLTGLYTRGVVFAIIVIMNLVFIILGSLGWLPLAGRITAVSLGGVAIAAMMTINIISDVGVLRRMFSAPGAYLYALTPAPRKHILLASVITVMVMDLTTMAVVIIGEVWQAIILAGDSIWRTVLDAINANPSVILYGIWGILLSIMEYLVLILLILFFITVMKSIFYKKPGGWILNILFVLGVIYVLNLLQIVLAPFGEISRYGLFFTVSIDGVGVALYILLRFIEAAALFIITSRLMERKMNI